MIQKIHLYTSEKRNVTFDFTGKIVSGETLSGPSVSASPTLTLGTPAVSGALLTVAASGGTDGTTYRLRATANTSAGQILLGLADLVFSDDT
jgi:hypothetical protein